MVVIGFVGVYQLEVFDFVVVVFYFYLGVEEYFVGIFWYLFDYVYVVQMFVQEVDVLVDFVKLFFVVNIFGIF